MGTIFETYVEYTPNDTNLYYYYYYTSDYGATWTQYSPNDSIIAEQMDIVPGQNVIVAVGSGIHFTFDGRTWNSLPDYYNLFHIYSIDLATDTYGYMGSSKWSFANGAWIFGYNDKAIPDFASSVERSCQNSDVEFTNQSLGMVNNLEWNFGEGANPQTAIGPGPHTVSYSTPGTKTITLTVTDVNGNQFTKTKEFIVDSQAPDYLAQIQGEIVPLINNAYTYYVEDQGDKYKWEFPSLWSIENTADTSIKQVTVKGSLGQKEITVTPYNGCGQGQTSTLIVTVVGGIDKAYPNPSSDYVYIENTENSSVYVYNHSGKLVEKIDNASYLTVLNVADSKYTNGLYTVVIVDQEGTKRSVKILVVK